MTRNHRMIWVIAFLLLSLLHLIFFLYLKFFVISDLREKIAREKKALGTVQAEEGKLLNPELRSTFETYSKGILAVENLFAGRDQVFIGKLGEKDYDPVMVLSYPDFFTDFEKLLEKHTVISNLSIDPAGKVGFLLEGTSFGRIAAQIELLRSGNEKIPLFKNLEVSHIAARSVTGKKEEIPKVFETWATVYGALVEARINPDFYLPQ